MRLPVVLMFGGFALLAAGAGAAKFGGDDGNVTGATPPDKTSAKCEVKVAKAAAKTIAKLTACHLKAAAAALKSKTFDEEKCETDATPAFTPPASCPPCLAKADPKLLEQLVDTGGWFMFCGGTKPFGDSDDGGTVPTDKKALTCESRVIAATAKLSGRIIKCNAAFAGQALKNKTFDTDGCVSKAQDKFKATKTSDCPSCVGTLTARPLLRRVIDLNNGRIFCASPSGAFIDGTLD